MVFELPFARAGGCIIGRPRAIGCVAGSLGPTFHFEEVARWVAAGVRMRVPRFRIIIILITLDTADGRSVYFVPPDGGAFDPLPIRGGAAFPCVAHIFVYCSHGVANELRQRQSYKL